MICAAAGAASMGMVAFASSFAMFATGRAFEPRWMEERGCGYGVEVKCPELRMGLEVLRREKIPFRKSYLLHADGVAEELSDDLP